MIIYFGDLRVPSIQFLTDHNYFFEREDPWRKLLKKAFLIVSDYKL